MNWSVEMNSSMSNSEVNSMITTVSTAAKTRDHKTHAGSFYEALLRMGARVADDQADEIIRISDEIEKGNDTPAKMLEATSAAAKFGFSMVQIKTAMDAAAEGMKTAAQKS
jgi:hypothetical protein